MKLWSRATSLVLVCLLLAPSGSSQTQTTSGPCISSSATARVAVKPDLAIVMLVLRSSAALANDALAQNQGKAGQVRLRLQEMGLADKAKFTGTRFSTAGQPYYGGGPRPQFSGFEATEYLYVFLDGPELDDAAKFDHRVAEVIDKLTGVGATAMDIPVPRLCQQNTCTVAFTVKDPSAALKEATAKAARQAREAAGETARGLGVQITGVRTIFQNTNTMGYQPNLNPLDDLPYEFYSSSREGLFVSATVTVQCSLR